MKTIFLMCLILIPSLVQGAVIFNICDNTDDKKLFEKVVDIKKSETDENYSLKIKLPSEFKNTYSFKNISLEMYQTKVIKLGDRIIERKKLILDSYLDSNKFDSSYFSFINFSADVSEDIQLHVIYKEELPSGVEIPDADICSFILNWNDT